MFCEKIRQGKSDCTSGPTSGKDRGNFAILDYLIVCILVDLIFAKDGKLRFGHQAPFSPTKGLLESWYWARPAEMEENKEEEEEEVKDGNRGWRLVSRCLEKEQPCPLMATAGSVSKCDISHRKLSRN